MVGTSQKRKIIFGIILAIGLVISSLYLMLNNVMAIDFPLPVHRSILTVVDNKTGERITIPSSTEVHILSDSEYFLLQSKLSSLLLEFTDVDSAGVAVRAIVDEPIHIAAHLNIAHELSDAKVSAIISILNSALSDFSTKLSSESVSIVITGVLDGEAAVIYSSEDYREY